MFPVPFLVFNFLPGGISRVCPIPFLLFKFFRAVFALPFFVQVHSSRLSSPFLLFKLFPAAFPDPFLVQVPFQFPVSSLWVPFSDYVIMCVYMPMLYIELSPMNVLGHQWTVENMKGRKLWRRKGAGQMWGMNLNRRIRGNVGEFEMGKGKGHHERIWDRI